MRYRDLFLAVMFTLLAFVLAGCPPTAIQKATDTLDKITIANRDARVAYQAVVSERLDAIATEERDRRTAALKASGCPLDPQAPQPTEECKKIVSDAQATYDGRKGKVVAVATKLNASSEAVYGALLTAVDVLILVRDGKQGQWPRLTALIAEVTKLAEVFKATWDDFQKNAKSY